MRVGLIARCDDRGLGNMTWEFARAMRPDVVLVVVCTEKIGKEFVQHVDRFDFIVEGGGRVLVAEWDGGPLPSGSVGELLRDVDVVYSAETFYDPQLVLDARVFGTATVLHVMPEFHRADLPQPTATWLPTSWRADKVPGATIVPVPVALDRFPPMPHEVHEGPVRWLHTAGNRAALDRNGTSSVLAAARQLRKRATITITCQRGRVPAYRAAPGVEVVVDQQPAPNYWSVYHGHEALVLPRRYGGLCLPAQEAMAAGLAVLMPNVAPNHEWPAKLVPARRGGHLKTSAGPVEVFNLAAGDLATHMDRLADRDELSRLRWASRTWACEHSWDVLRQRYVDELAAVL